ncbi:DUF5677 domain-containing protein [Burkholderia gladioli]|uniref:DUF5677 domain-containing protein n=1 Tax=Burkholderia gladioli TaxID=28095 RepID=UPI00163E03E5|nr:DUF5677 domain-containing protein [Burkholderia gladioli]
MTFENDFETLGFLADLPDERDARKKRFQMHFDTCYSLSHDATRLARFLLSISLPERYQQVAAALWFRCAGAGQGAVLLAERGMPAEAASLARSSLESLFWGAALIQDPNVLQLLKNNDQASVKKAANGMLNYKGVQYSQADRALLQEKGEGADVVSTSVLRAAQISDLVYLYESAYRGLSRWGVHAGIATASFGVSDGRLAFAPSDEFIEDILGAVEQGVGKEGLKRFGDFANSLAKSAIDSVAQVSNPSQQ